MNRYVLRWQYGLFNNEVKIHYTYGDIDTLREKAKVLAKDDKILVIEMSRKPPGLPGGCKALFYVVKKY